MISLYRVSFFSSLIQLYVCGTDDLTSFGIIKVNVKSREKNKEAVDVYKGILSMVFMSHKEGSNDIG